MNRSMKVYLTSAQWADLQVDSHHEFVRSAFYLSLPYTYIAHRVKHSVFDRERKQVIESAQELGITEADVLVKIKGS